MSSRTASNSSSISLDETLYDVIPKEEKQQTEKEKFASQNDRFAIEYIRAIQCLCKSR